MPNVLDNAQHGGALKLHRRATFDEVSIALLQPQSHKNPTLVGIGTALAVKYTTSGVPALSTTGAGRGGARNRADRQSHALTASQTGNLKAAERHAIIIGLPFTRMITIHWEAAGLPLEDMARATGRFIDLLTKTLARHDRKTSWLFVHENASVNSHDKGGHVHLLVHVPADLVPAVTCLQRGWLRRIVGRPYRARVIHSKPIGGRLWLEAGNPDLLAVNLEAALAYVLKGANPDCASQFGLKRVKSGGRVIGKRCGVSQNIAQAARQAWLVNLEPSETVNTGPKRRKVPI